MKRVLGFGVLLVGAVVLFGGRSVADDKAQKAPGAGQVDADQQAKMAAWMQMGAVGEHHAHLKPLVGKWTYVSKWWMAPGMDPQADKGTAVYKSLLGGRYVSQELTGSGANEDQFTYEGFGVSGYDNGTQKHTSMWIDNMSTMISFSDGTCDPSGKVFTMTGEVLDPIEKKMKKHKSILRIINNDKHVFEMFESLPDGTEYRSLEVTYTRAS